MAYDGDYNDLAYTTIYPSYSGYQSAYGHTDFYGDMDYGSVYLSSSGYYNVSSTGNTSSYLYDGTTGSWLSGNYNYLYSSHTYYDVVYGYTTGQNYSVTVSPSYSYSSGYDGDSSDLAYTTVYPSYSGYQTVYGHTDFYGDMDYGSVYLSSSGYYNVSSTGNTSSYLYDGTTGSWLSGNYNYLYASHTYYDVVYGYTTGQTYSVTVAPSSYYSGYDGDSYDLAYTTVYPSYSSYQTASGHTDYYGDMDYGSVYLSSSGYYNVSSTGNTSSYLYDGTTGSWLSGSYNYLYASHTYYDVVYGYTTGQTYSVTVSPSY